MELNTYYSKDLIGRKFHYKNSYFEIVKLHCINSVWPTGKVQYHCEYIPREWDTQYPWIYKFECFPEDELVDCFGLALYE